VLAEAAEFGSVTWSEPFSVDLSKLFKFSAELPVRGELFSYSRGDCYFFKAQSLIDIFSRLSSLRFLPEW